MDRASLLTRLDASTDALVAEGGRGSPRFRRMVRLARRLRIDALRARYTSSAYQLEKGHLHPLRRRLDDLTLVAFDLEWSPDGPPFDEMGIAIWRRGSFVSVVNLRVDGTGDRGSSRHGPTIATTHEDAVARLQAALADADLVVTHAGANDRNRISLGGWRLPSAADLPRIDVQGWHRMAAGRSAPARLMDLCERWSIRFRGRHVAANDAVATMRVALAMIKYGPSPERLPGPFTEPVPRSLRGTGVKESSANPWPRD